MHSSESLEGGGEGGREGGREGGGEGGRGGGREGREGGRGEREDVMDGGSILLVMMV